MKAFIFGSFNPVTNAHIEMGLAVRNALGSDAQIIYEPASDRYLRSWKGYQETDILPEDVRLRLLYEAAKEHDFIVSSIEIIGLTDGRTYNTLAYYGLKDSVLCLGMDNIAELPKWYKWQELLQKVKLLIFRREDQMREASREVSDVLARANSYQIVDLPGQDGISATRVRDYYREGRMEEVKALVPVNVYEYYCERKKEECEKN